MISLTSPIRTPFHRLPAASKLLFLCGFTFVIFWINSPTLNFAAVVFVTSLYAWPGIRFLIHGLRRLMPIAPFIVVVLAWHLIADEPLTGVAICLKLIATVALANLVTMTSRLDDLIEVVRGLLSPLRRVGIKIPGLELAIALVIRFVPVLSEKGTILAMAWKVVPRVVPGGG